MRIHRVGKLHHSLEAARLEVKPSPHRPYDLCKTLKVGFLHHERVALEKRNDDSFQLAKRVNRIGHHAARRPFGPHAATTEEQDEVFEHLSVPLVSIHVKQRMESAPASSSC